jgi:para-nitrobenzyl esterase
MKFRNRYKVVAAVAAVALIPAAMAYAGQTEEKHMDGRVVATDTGKVRGQVHGDHRLFQGIPYAAPPQGELRWQPPQPPKSWDGVHDATKPGSPCPQLTTPYGGEGSTNEDCLFLNVTTPRAEKSDDPKPVMVWIHGDGAIGSGDIFDARRLAARGDVVVVTLNYRMGVFGAFGHPELPDSGTLGLQDQRAALEWVQRNAAAFGGDASNVTLFGVSFGATAIAGHLISSRSQGLFQKAIMHSGFSVMDSPAGAMYPFLGALEWFGWKSDAQVRETGAAVAAELGCADPETALDCLRDKPVKELLDYPSVMNLFQSYAYGSKDLPEVPQDAMAAGDFPDIPIMAGSTRDEHRTLTAIREMSGYPMTETEYRPALHQAFGEHAEQVAQQYPLSDYDNAALAFSSVMTDRMWSKATFRQNTLLSQRSPLYFFEFADRTPPEEFPFPEGIPSGAYHNSDISYLFPTPEFTDKMSPEQRRLSDDMIDYWSSFSRTGDPAAEGGPAWDRFNDTGHVQALAPGGDGIGGVDYVTEHNLEFWNSLD